MNFSLQPLAYSKPESQSCLAEDNLDISGYQIQPIEVPWLVCPVSPKNTIK